MSMSRSTDIAIIRVGVLIIWCGSSLAKISAKHVASMGGDVNRLILKFII